MRVLLASDGSAAARAALRVALGFPWPEGTRVRGVVALGRVHPGMNARRVRALHARADELRKALRRKWSAAEVFELHDRPAEAILREARRFRADIVVIGWRGHGALARLVAGSVSRRVAEGASCPVLVVRAGRSAPRAALRRFAVGFDAAPNSARATRFMARLTAPHGNRVALVSVVQSLSSRIAQVKSRLEVAARALRARGWTSVAIVRSGEPTGEILDAAAKLNAQVLVVGFASRSGFERVVLGSVATGILNRSRLPVLIAR